MFKVECLGCQAPYQVDEKRVPDKGLKMRCPKCGTSFRVEPPAGSAGAGGTPIDAADLPDTPASAPRPFTSGGFQPGKVPGKPPGSSRDPLSRTMIGVSSADLGLGPKTPPGEAAKPKPFRIPRPNAGAPVAEAPAAHAGAAKAAEPTAVSSPLEALPAFAAESGQVQEAWIPAESEAPPESLAEPSSPLSLSELPQPFAAGLSGHPAIQIAQVTSQAPEGLELDYGDDLPVAALPGRKPPPRRARALTAADKTGAPPEAKVDKHAPAPEAIDLPARLEDLRSSSPKPAPARAAPPAPAAERVPSRPKSSSLDELDLPDLLGRDGVAGLPAPRLPRRAELVSAAGPPPAAPKAAP
ncbi:MAG: zinc-ribbon domain-containing protein, partial [Deltaproteobacteria bacterium]